MQYVCDAPKGRTWFRIETEAEATAESRLMRHAVEKHFLTAQQRARRSYVPGQGLERDIGLKGHIARTMPVFLTLRADDGSGLATAMLPPESPKRETVAWCVERADGGRGFGIVMPHFYKNWAMEDLRRFILNGIVWTAKIDVPELGVQTETSDLKALSPKAVEYVPPIPKAKK